MCFSVSLTPGTSVQTCSSSSPFPSSSSSTGSTNCNTAHKLLTSSVVVLLQTTSVWVCFSVDCDRYDRCGCVLVLVLQVNKNNIFHEKDVLIGNHIKDPILLLQCLFFRTVHPRNRVWSMYFLPTHINSYLLGILMGMLFTHNKFQAARKARKQAFSLNN